MLSVMMLSLLVSVTDVADVPMTAFSQQGDPPVKLWLSRDRVQLGDRVQVDVRTESDGYLLVLHAEPDGRVRVLFPLDPIEDNFVRGGDEFEIRGRGDRETFRVYASEGVGTVYAAFSRDPFQFEEFVRGDHWDYGARDVWYVVEDPEPEITDLVLSLASGAYFDYDFVQYAAGDAVVAARQRSNLSLYADPYSYNTYNVGIHFGSYYDPVYRYRGLWSIGYVGWPSYRYGCWHGSWSCFDPWHYNYYDPWYYGGYYGGYYGSYYGYGYGYGYYYPDYYRYRYRSPTVVVYGDNRLRTISTRTRLQPANGVNRGRRVYAGTLGSSVRRTSAANRISPASRRIAANNVAGRTPQRATATATNGRRTVDSPRTTPTQRVTGSARRSVNATAQQPQTRTTRPATTARRATPSRTTPTARQATPSRATPVTTRRATPNRVTSSRPATTRSTPVRSSRPTSSRSVPVRSSRPTSSRSTPVRSSRPTSSRSTPVRSSQPTGARSAPVRSSRPTASRSAPVRSSGSSAATTSRKPTTTTRRRKP